MNWMEAALPIGQPAPGWTWYPRQATVSSDLSHATIRWSDLPTPCRLAFLTKPEWNCKTNAIKDR